MAKQSKTEAEAVPNAERWPWRVTVVLRGSHCTMFYPDALPAEAARASVTEAMDQHKDYGRNDSPRTVTITDALGTHSFGLGDVQGVSTENHALFRPGYIADLVASKAVEQALAKVEA